MLKSKIKIKIKLLMLAVCIVFVLPIFAFGAELPDIRDDNGRIGDLLNNADFLTNARGYFLLDPRENEDIWYIHPLSARPYNINRSFAAFKTISQQGIGVSNATLKKIPTAKSSSQGNVKLRKKLAGRILIQVKNKGKAWYVNPKDLKRYYLGRSDKMLSAIRRLSVPIYANDDPEEVQKAPSVAGGIDEIISGQEADKKTAANYQYQRKKIITARGTFNAEIIEIDFSDNRLKIISDAISETECHDNCPTKSLEDFVIQNKAVAGVIGTYFCPKDYHDCADHDGSFQWMMYNHTKDVMINEYRNKTNKGSLVVFDDKQRSYFYLDTKKFEGKKAFEEKNGAKITAAISNWPALRYEAKSVFNPKTIDKRQLSIRGNRSAIGLKGRKVYFIAVRGGTIPDLSAVIDHFEMDYALNLDGGGFYFDDQYIVGPGRNIPNALLLVEN